MAGISDEAVKKATGKTRAQWFAILDKAGAKKMPHREIVRFLYDKHLGKRKGDIGVTSPTGWWSQMVTVEYERARGLRSVNQNADGFLVGVHKTLPMSRAQFLKRWQKLPPVKKLTPTPTRSVRPMLRYKAKEGIVVVTMDDRPGGKLRVMVEAARLPKKSLVEKNRALWRKQLDAIE